MSYSEVLETAGDYRVKIIADEDAHEPYDDGASPLLRVSPRRAGGCAEHVQVGARPAGDDDRIENAIAHWDATPSYDTWDLFEKYLRAFYGVTQIETWWSGSYWYVTYDSARWREHTGAPAGSADMAEYKSWCEGDCYGYIVEKRVTWTTDDPDYDNHDEWEPVPDGSCWGFYGHEDVESEARAALASFAHQPAEEATR